MILFLKLKFYQHQCDLSLIVSYFYKNYFFDLFVVKDYALSTHFYTGQERMYCFFMITWVSKE